ncbi:unnamed protein product [Peronospora belbahrii]|uniref:Uncharacterized protein n=1 Tax=Peronospora belbahrii TaxID=622444 RepID=A0ABN8D4F9_9STRA|nr:unnamed protein product [Peronospora belbahrii]
MISGALGNFVRNSEELYKDLCASQCLYDNVLVDEVPRRNICRIFSAIEALDLLETEYTFTAILLKPTF